MRRGALHLLAIVCAAAAWSGAAAVTCGCASGDFRLAEDRGVDPLTSADARADDAHDAPSIEPGDSGPSEDASTPPDSAAPDSAANDSVATDARDGCSGSVVDLQTTLLDAKLAASLSRSREHAITHRLRHDGSIRAVTLTFSRHPYACPAGGKDCGSPDPACSSCTSSGSGSCNCSVGTSTLGSITLDVVAGAPGSGGAVLATSEVSLASVSSAETAVRFALATTRLSTGTNVHFRLRTDSTAWQLTMYGSVAGSPPLGTAWWRRTIYPWGGWMGDSVFTPVMRVEIEECE